MVLDEPISDRFGRVVVPGHQFGTIDVTDTFLLGRVEVDVVDVVGLGTDPPPTEPANDLLVRHVDQDHCADLQGDLIELLFQGLCLGQGPREAVEDEPVGGFRRGDPLGDHSDDHLIRNEVAPVHVLLRLESDRSPLPNGGPEDVAGRVVGEFEVLLQALALGPLAGTRGAEQDEVQVGQAI